MNIYIKQRIRRLYNLNFSIPELAIMYNVSETKIERVLEYGS